MGKLATEEMACTRTDVAFQARMKAQCKQIEQYRLTVMRNEGRRLSEDEAALEWISSFAEDFDGAAGAG